MDGKCQVNLLVSIRYYQLPVHVFVPCILNEPPCPHNDAGNVRIVSEYPSGMFTLGKRNSSLYGPFGSREVHVFI